MTDGRPSGGVHRAGGPVGQLVHASQHLNGSHSGEPEGLCDPLPPSVIQVALGQLEHEVPRMPDQPPAGLEEPLLETRQGPALDGDRQNEPAQQIAEVIGNDPASLPSLIHCSAVPRRL